MKDVIKHIETEKRTYPIVFNLNVMEEIQEHYGSMSAWGDLVADGEEPKSICTAFDLSDGYGAVCPRVCRRDGQQR